MATTGNKGKFADRLKRILFFRKKKKKEASEEYLEDSNRIYANFLNVVAAIPGLVYGSVVSDDKAVKEGEKTFQEDNRVLEKPTVVVTRVNRRKLINDIDVASIKRKQETFRRVPRAVAKRNILTQEAIPQREVTEPEREKTVPTAPNVSSAIDTRARVNELEKSIINLIKKDLIKIVNELEILQSELYILSEVNGESKELKECQKELDQVKSILCKIDKLKEKYDFLKDNYDFEYLLEIDNDDIVDKIIELRDTFGNNELKAVAEDYKLLDVYKYLYLKIDDLQDKTAAFEKKKTEEEAKLKERDIDFNKLKNDVYNVDYRNRNYEAFVNNQNELLKEIDENVNKISSYEEVDYHLKGFGALFRNSFKYFGLLMMSPLKGVIPSIATETIITGNLIKNLYRKLEWEETRKMVYEAIDYSNMISNAIDDLESTGRIVDATLDDIVHLKMKYNEKFRKYQGDFTEYRDIMHKINDMENKILGNKIKIEMMRKRALEQQRANTKKLVLVKELNRKETV